ncbi:MAG: Fe-S cluster assembly protein SufB [Brockia lithotrophica]|nr:Fe-S cluster assembly protein SufB [Brockia lithotrophica]
MDVADISFLPDAYRYGFRDPEAYVFKAPKGLTRDLVLEISRMKGEPDWMTAFRLKALDLFLEKPLPRWGPDLSGIDFEEIVYYVKPTERKGRSWDEVPLEIKRTFERLGIPEAEQKFLAGVTAQYESEVVYASLKEELGAKGVIFLDTDTALKEYPELFREYFATVVPPSDNKFAALNSAVWSGGTFIYVPRGVRLEIPLQAYFRINAENMGQFERTLIIVDEGASVHYVEGCTAPLYASDSLHAAVVEVIVKRGARARYTTIQNWSPNVYNLVTKRASVEAHGTMEWVDGNLGSKVTMKYPSVILRGEGAHADVLSIALAGKGQVQDAGTKILVNAPNCTATVVSKSIAKDGGKVNYRGLVLFGPEARGSRAKVDCATLLLDDESFSDTVPYNEVKTADVVLEHEASVSKVSEEQLFYLMSRGLSETEATQLIVQGFLQPFTKELPMEYALELNRLIELEIEGGLG